MTAPATNILFVGSFVDGAVGTRGISLDLASKLRSVGWPTITVSRKERRVSKLVDMLSTAWIQRSDYEVALVDVYSGPAFFWSESVCWLLRRMKKPYVLCLHGGNLPAFTEKWTARVRLLLSSAHTVTTPSRYLHEKMYPYRRDLRIIPNPVDVAAYPFRVRTSAKPSLVWLRAYHSVYEPWTAIEAMRLLAPELEGATLTMYGPDKLDGTLHRVQSTVHNFKLTDRISVRGAIPKPSVPAALSAADIFVNTTAVDNTPVSILEAMACGLCIVSTNVGGIPYLLEHERDALLIPPGQPEALAAAIKRIVQEPGLAQRLSANARIKAEQFDWSKVLPAWQALFGSFQVDRRD